MIKSISWNEFLTSIGILMSTYYVAIVILYYKREFMGILSNRRKLALSKLPQKQNFAVTDANVAANNSREQSTADNILMPVVHELMEELNQVITIAGRKHYAREELVFSIQQILNNYQQLKSTNFQLSINNYIGEEIVNHCSIHLSAGEMNTLWMN